MEVTKVKRLKLILILLPVCMALNQAFAQGGETTIEGDPEIIIRKDRKITLLRATRNFEKIPQVPVQPASKKQKYTFKAYHYSLSPIQPVFRARRLSLFEKRQEVTGKYIKAGYGNFGTLYGEAHLSSRRNEHYVFNLYGRHLSSATGPVFGKNSGSSNTDLTVGGKSFNGKNTVSGSLEYLRRVRRFYGYHPALDISAARQRFTGLSAKLGIEKNNENEVQNYHFLTDWHFFRDDFKARESQFNFDAGFSYQLNEQLEVKLRGLATFSIRRDAKKTNRNLFNLKPRLFYDGNSFRLSVGGNLATDNDDLSTFTGANGGFRVFPYLRLDMTPSRRISFYAGYEGDLEMNTFRSLADENPWLQADFALFNTEKESDVFGGINLNLSEAIRLHAGLSLAALQRLPFLTNAMTDSTRFEVLYDRDAINRTNIYSEVSYESPGKFRSGLRLDFFHYKLVTLADAYHKPNYQAVWNATFFPLKDLTVSGDLYYMGGLVGLNQQSNLRTVLNDIIDLNLHGKYDLKEEIGVFLQIRNIFGREYQRFLNYPNRGIQFLAGVVLSF